MMNILKKFFACLVALLLLSSLFVACKEESNGEEQSGEGEVTAEISGELSDTNDGVTEITDSTDTCDDTTDTTASTDTEKDTTDTTVTSDTSEDITETSDSTDASDDTTDTTAPSETTTDDTIMSGGGDEDWGAYNPI